MGLSQLPANKERDPQLWLGLIENDTLRKGNLLCRQIDEILYLGPGQGNPFQRRLLFSITRSNGVDPWHDVS